MTNLRKKIVLASITVIVAAGLLALNPSMIGNAQAQMYSNDYGYNSNYYQDDNRYGYDSHEKKSSNGDIQKISCVSSNINVNGIDITKIPEDTTATAAAAANEGAADATGAQNGNGWADKINFNRNLVNICVNVNANNQTKVTPPPEEEFSPCEDCFAVLTQEELKRLLANELVDEPSIGAFCHRLVDTPNSCLEVGRLIGALFNAQIPEDKINIILQCLIDAHVVLSVSQCPG